MRILHYSDSPFSTTGFSTQSLNILNGLTDKGYECHYIGHNHLGQSIPPNNNMLADGTPFKFYLHGNNLIGNYSQELIVPKIREIKPDFFGVLLDLFMVYPGFLNLDLAPALSYFYFPSDGGGSLPLNCQQILQKVNIPIAMSKYAQQQAKEVHKIDTHYIPHGVDIKNFHKVSDEQKNQWRKENGLQDKFIIGIVGRNQPRKMHDNIIRVARKICDIHDNILFYMHLDPTDKAASFDITKLIERFSLQNRFISSGVQYYNSFTYEKMNKLYNMMDIYLSVTSGEGFGICTIEAMACQLPVIITDYTTSKELIEDDGKAGELIKLKAEVTGSWNVDRGIIDVDDCVTQIDKLYKDMNLRKKYGEAGRKKVEKLYNWTTVIEQWDNLFKKHKNG